LQALPQPYLVVVGLTVGQALFLIMPVSQEGLLALGTDKVLGERGWPRGFRIIARPRNRRWEGLTAGKGLTLP
jgi:hypothetical protein